VNRETYEDQYEAADKDQTGDLGPAAKLLGHDRGSARTVVAQPSATPAFIPGDVASWDFSSW